MTTQEQLISLDESEVEDAVDPRNIMPTSTTSNPTYTFSQTSPSNSSQKQKEPHLQKKVYTISLLWIKKKPSLITKFLGLNEISSQTKFNNTSTCWPCSSTNRKELHETELLDTENPQQKNAKTTLVYDNVWILIMSGTTYYYACCCQDDGLIILRNTNEIDSLFNNIPHNSYEITGMKVCEEEIAKSIITFCNINVNLDVNAILSTWFWGKNFFLDEMQNLTEFSPPKFLCSLISPPNIREKLNVLPTTTDVLITDIDSISDKTKLKKMISDYCLSKSYSGHFWGFLFFLADYIDVVQLKKGLKWGFGTIMNCYRLHNDGQRV